MTRPHTGATGPGAQQPAALGPPAVAGSPTRRALPGGEYPLVRQRGSVTVIVAGLAAALLLVAGGIVGVTHAAALRTRAQALADFGALVAAQAVLDGAAPAAGCDLAREVIVANGAHLVACEPVDIPPGAITVTVRLNVEMVMLPGATTQARATAGEPPR